MIKTINLQSGENTIVEQLVSSLQETGFAVLTNHSINTQLLDDVYRGWGAFFASQQKLNWDHKGSQRGYFPFRSENAKDSPAKDLKEFFHFFSPYKDTEAPIFLADDTQELAVQLEALGVFILDLLDCDSRILNSHEGLLTDWVARSNSTLFRILHYPPLPTNSEPGAVRAAAHEDINLITLLPAATAPGLEVKDLAGNWHKVECDPGSIIINVGDMLQEATGGLLRSTTHRVVNPIGPEAENSRYSLPLFVHPRPEVRLSERFTSGEYLEQRLREIGLIK